MAPKRPLESDGAATPAAKKIRKGFRVGPENLPDGPWRRKVDRKKKDLIHTAKVKKAYQKIKAAKQASSQPDATTPANTTDDVDDDDDAPPSPKIHPERLAMLDEDEDEPESPAPPPTERQPRQRWPKQNPRKPDYFNKAKADAERKRAEADARTQEFEKRNAERNGKIAERERFKKALAKARTPGRDGQRKLGRESGLLLEKVKKMVGNAK